MKFDLKYLTFAMLALVLGVVALALGAVSKFAVGTTVVEIKDIVPRIALMSVGGVLILTAVGLQLFDALKRKADIAGDPEAATPKALSAESFFLTVDDQAAQTFPVSTRGAVKIQILARTIVNLMNNYAKTFDALAAAGCEIQILIVDPTSEAAHHLYNNDFDQFTRNSKSALDQIQKLRARFGMLVKVNYFASVPSVSIINVQTADVATSYAQVQLYFLHGAIGRDRPIFRVARSDKWYPAFIAEFDNLWRTSYEAPP